MGASLPSQTAADKEFVSWIHDHSPPLTTMALKAFRYKKALISPLLSVS